ADRTLGAVGFLSLAGMIEVHVCARLENTGVVPQHIVRVIGRGALSCLNNLDAPLLAGLALRLWVNESTRGFPQLNRHKLPQSSYVRKKSSMAFCHITI